MTTGYGKQLREILEDVHEKVRKNLLSAGAAMKRRYDKSADIDGFQPGDAVWLYNPRVKKTLSPKLSRPWEGPYRVMERLTDVVYRIQRSPKSKPRVVNRFRLWRVSGELPDDWWEATARTIPNIPNTTDCGLDIPDIEPDDKDYKENVDDDKYDSDSSDNDNKTVTYTTRTGRLIKRPRSYRV